MKTNIATAQKCHRATGIVAVAFFICFGFPSFGQTSRTVFVNPTTGIVSSPANFWPSNYLQIISALSPFGSTGDLLYRDAAGWTNLGTGSAGQALFVKSGGGYAWSNVVASSSSSTSYSPTNATWSGLTIVSDCSKSYFFRVLLTNTTPATLQAPTNAADGAVVRWEFQQDGTGSREVVLGSGLQGGAHVTGINLSTTAWMVDYASAIYRQSSNVWNIISNPGGYP